VVHEQEMHIAVVPLDVARHWRRGRGRHSAWPTQAHRIVQLDMCGPDITEARSFSGLACELSSPAVGVAQSLLSQWGGVSVCVWCNLAFCPWKLRCQMAPWPVRAFLVA
jgi:hypothetical protein